MVGGDDAGRRGCPVAAGPLAGPDETNWIVDTDPDVGDDYLIASSGYLRPATLRLGVGSAAPVEIAQAGRRRSSTPTGLTVRQFFATSADGTRVPYFVVGDPTRPAGPDAAHRVRRVRDLPDARTTAGCIGRGWLARGGTYVVANIRGGGEYGPQWHRAALRENRPRAYEDFAAVAADLVARGITTPQQLGIEGGSNGGLLMGVMLTRYPTLFGAVVANVPLLDMRRYHLLLAGRLLDGRVRRPGRAGRLGLPARIFAVPQRRGPGVPYPPVLFVTSTRDDRVHPGHARKMAARLREHGPRRGVLRERRGRARRGGQQRAAGVPVGVDAGAFCGSGWAAGDRCADGAIPHIAGIETISIGGYGISKMEMN